MPKYTRKGMEDSLDQEMANELFHAQLVEEDTKLDTKYGEVLVTPGNYILTDSKGEKIGITPIDLELNYKQED